VSETGFCSTVAEEPQRVNRRLPTAVVCRGSDSTQVKTGRTSGAETSQTIKTRIRNVRVRISRQPEQEWNRCSSPDSCDCATGSEMIVRRALIGFAVRQKVLFRIDVQLPHHLRSRLESDGYFSAAYSSRFLRSHRFV
jgi:hypothetical protein